MGHKMKTEQELMEGARVWVQAVKDSGRHCVLAMLLDDNRITSKTFCNGHTGAAMAAEIIYRVKKHEEELE